MTEDVRRRLVVEAHATQAKKQLNSVAQSVDKINKELDQQTKAAKKSSDAMTAALRKELQSSDKTAKKIVENEEKKQKAKRKTLQQQQESFDSTSRKVALAGDFQSNLGAVSGLGGMALGGGVGTGVSTIGEIAVLAEELPRLKEAAKGLPATLGSAAKALGPAGIFVGALVAGIAVLVKASQDAAAEMKAALDARLKAEESYAEQIASGSITAQDAEAELIRLQNVQKAQQELINQAQADRDAVFEQAVADGLGIDVVGRTREALGLTTSQELDSALDRRKSALRDTTAAIAVLTKELEAGNIPLGENKELIKQREEAERELEKSLKEVERTEKDLSKAIDKRRNAVIDARKREEDAARKLAERLQAVEAAARNAADKALRGLQDSLKDTSQALRDDLAMALINAARESRDARIQFERDERDARIEHNRKLLDIQKSFDRRRRDAVQSNDAAALFAINQERKDALEDEQETLANSMDDAERARRDEARDRSLALRDEQLDLRNAAENRRRDLRTSYQRELREQQIAKQQQIKDAHTAYQRELELAREASKARLQILSEEIAAIRSLLSQQSTTATNVANTNNLNFNINNATSNTQQEVFDALDQVIGA